MENLKLKVEGMNCTHCEKAVQNALEDLGVESVIASAKNNTVEIVFNPANLSTDAIKSEITETGYTVIS